MGKVKNNRICGSTSIFFCLVLLLVSSLLFTLLEGARVEGLKACVRMNSDLVTESVLAEYVKPLWENYHLLAGNGGNTNGELGILRIAQSAKQKGEDNLEWQGIGKRGLWMYPLHIENAEVTNYHLITDGEGEGFYHLVIESMKKSLPVDAAEAIYERIKKVQKTEEDAGDVSVRVDEAKSCVEQAKEEENEDTDEGTEAKVELPVPSMGQDGKEMENPLEYIGEWKSTAVLTLLGADTSGMSVKKINTRQTLEKRKKNTGNWEKGSQEDTWYERILFQEYLLKYFKTYPAGKTKAKQDTSVRQDAKQAGLDYETEYLIVGKASDKQNLQGALDRILLLREAANFIYLQTDEQKKSEALTLATLLVGATGNGLLVKGVQQGILAVWAFAESVSDVRSLLAGEKIPIIKTSSEWSTDVGGLSKESGFQEAKKCKEGLEYKDYLRVLLFMTGKAKLCYRAMDLIEWNLQAIEGYSNLQMDMLWDRCILRYGYWARPMFLSLGIGRYQWSISKIGTYRED